VQPNSQIYQGNAATDLRSGGRFNTTFLCSLFANGALKELVKLV